MTVNKKLPAERPRGNAAGFRRYLVQDLTSGFLVFLIALPLCLGISQASGYPPIAGVFTAIIGALLTTCISNSELTIKGPAAGLIVIVVGCVEAFGGNGMIGGWEPADALAYRSALAVGCAAAVFQVLFGFMRAGILGEFFPTTAVHGMLAAIGIIIMIKQVPVALGVSASGEPLHMLYEFPRYFREANPDIALIGVVSLIIMFCWPTVRKNSSLFRPIPAPLIVLVVAVPMGMGMDLLHEHSYIFRGHEYVLSDRYLVKMPSRMFGMFDEITYPDFRALQQPVAWKWVFMFFAIGSLESLLSAKAVDLLDPWQRKTNMNRDMMAVGVANFAASFVGGLPMISEIVRSKANIDTGARTRFADFWHGVFLLLCVALIPTILHRIPLAALAAMLVYTGSRLAHPTEFVHVYRIGREQLAIFVITIIAVLATDLLVGIGIGIAAKFVIHVINGVPLSSLFKPYLETQELDDNTTLIVARESAVFSNWIPFRRQIEQIGLVQRRNVIVDVSNANLVDHSVMEKLSEMRRDFEQERLTFEIRGLETLRSASSAPNATRKRGLAPIRRITVTMDADLQPDIAGVCVDAGATGFTLMECRGCGRTDLQVGPQALRDVVRMEVIATPQIAEKILQTLHGTYLPAHRMTVCTEWVDVLRPDRFEPLPTEVPLEMTH